MHARVNTILFCLCIAWVEANVIFNNQNCIYYDTISRYPQTPCYSLATEVTFVKVMVTGLLSRSHDFCQVHRTLVKVTGLLSRSQDLGQGHRTFIKVTGPWSRSQDFYQVHRTFSRVQDLCQGHRTFVKVTGPLLWSWAYIVVCVWQYGGHPLHPDESIIKMLTQSGHLGFWAQILMFKNICPLTAHPSLLVLIRNHFVGAFLWIMSHIRSRLRTGAGGSGSRSGYELYVVQHAFEGLFHEQQCYRIIKSWQKMMCCFKNTRY